ncbi:hypothetical protein [Microbacterium sp. MYb62]|uniref:hypothetical protein n=1 Tax=Microbacterium sp. MYb62 TaxID=1848690 RepID=UPI0011B062F3|nr:hypothetical protein [Microbacterium sp. MYb62]
MSKLVQAARGVTVGMLAAVALVALVACSATATPVARDIYGEEDAETVTVSQVTPPRAGTADGSAVVFVPRLGDFGSIRNVVDGRARVSLCAVSFSEPNAVRGANDECHWVQSSDVGGMHVRIDGLDDGEHTLEVTLFERWDSEPVSTQRVSFEVPEATR